MKHKNYYQAVGVMVGYTIGVGIFSLPYLTAKAGVSVFLVFLLILGAVQYLVHLIYANLIIVTKNFHRLPGYVEIYLGKKGKIAVFVAKMIGNGGALIAYIIITGIFLDQIFGSFFGGSPFLYGTICYTVGLLVVFFGIGMIARFELYMSFLLFVVILLIVAKGSMVISMDNYFSLDWQYFLLPYGAMLVSLDGNGALPIVGRIINRETAHFKSVIRTSMLVSLFVTLIFTLTVVGITGMETTSDALSGMRNLLGNGVMTLALAFGVISMLTSIIGVAESVKETLNWDFGVNKNLAWFLVFFVPYILFVLGVNDLVEVISFIGSVGGGFSAIMLILVFMKLRKKKNMLPIFKIKPSQLFLNLIIGLFVLGMAYEVYFFIW